MPSSPLVDPSSAGVMPRYVGERLRVPLHDGSIAVWEVITRRVENGTELKWAFMAREEA